MSIPCGVYWWFLRRLEYLGQEVPRSWFESLVIFGVSDFWGRCPCWGTNFESLECGKHLTEHQTFCLAKVFVLFLGVRPLTEYGNTGTTSKWWMVMDDEINDEIKTPRVTSWGRARCLLSRCIWSWCSFSKGVISGWLVICNYCCFLVKTIRADSWTYCVLKNQIYI